MNRILVVGRTGQLSWELRRTLLPLGEVRAMEQPTLDLMQPDSIVRAVRDCRPDVIVNAAAYTAVDRAEQERELAFAINAVAPGLLAQEAAKLGALMIHYSTDYVFDGAKPGAYLESDPPNPLNVYGASKLAGEQAVQASGAAHLIFRTSWVYAARGRNFLRTMLQLAADRETLRVVADQIGAPTWARFLAEATGQVVAHSRDERATDRFESGVYHLAAGGEASWCDFARAIIEQTCQVAPGWPHKLKEILPIATEEYPLPARRPANSRLDCTLFTGRFGIAPAPWRDQLALCVEEMQEAR